MKKLQSFFDSPVRIIEEEAAAVAVLYGATWCEEASSALSRRITKRLGGAQVYVPQLSSEARSARNERVRSLFTGANLKQLARDFEMSERSIRRILTTEKIRSLD